MKTIIPASTDAYLQVAHPPALEALGELAAASSALSEAQRGAFDATQRLSDAVRDAHAARGHYDADVARGAIARDQRVEARLDRDVASAQSAAEKGQLRAETITRAAAGTATALTRTNAFAGEVSGYNAVIEPTKPIKLKVPADQALRDTMSALSTLDDEDADIKIAHAPKGDVKARAVAELAALDTRGRLQVNANGSLRWPQTVTAAMPIAGSAPVTMIDVAALLVSLNYDALLAQVEADVDAMYDGIPASQQLSAQQKKEKLAKNAEARFELELVEVAATRALWAEGHTDIGLRPDIDPRAVLGIRSWKPGAPRDTSRVAIL